MKYINLTIKLTDDLGMKSVEIMQNDTDMPSDSALIKMVAFTLIEALHLNKEDVELQDVLNELNIGKPK